MSIMSLYVFITAFALFFWWGEYDAMSGDSEHLIQQVRHYSHDRQAIADGIVS